MLLCGTMSLKQFAKKVTLIQTKTIATIGTTVGI
jgi:hypothetical protein